MKKRNKISLLLLGLFGMGIVLLLFLYFSAPAYINSEVVKKKVNAYFFQKTGGSIVFQESGIHLFPLPHIGFRQVRISIPGKADGLIQSLDVYLDLWSLLRGDVRFSRIIFVSPIFSAALSEDMEKASLEEIEGKMRSLVHTLTSLAPGLLVIVQEGKLELTKGDHVAFSFDTIRSRFSISGETLNISLSCTSPLWDNLSFNAFLHAEDLKSSGTLQITSFRPHNLFAKLVPKAGAHIGDSEAAISVRFETLGLQQVQAELTSSVPSLVLARGKDRITMKDLNFKGDIKVQPKSVSVLFSKFNTTYPDMKLSGEYTHDRTSGILGITLEGKSIDVQSMRSAALTLGRDITLIRTIFDIVQGGRIPALHFHAGGKSPHDLGQLENMRISGNIVDGDINIPAKDLRFHNVSGDVLVEKGILKGENIEASIGNHRGSKGKLRIGLKGKDAPLHLDTWVKADMAELPSLLRQNNLIRNKAVLEKMDRLSDTRGIVQGRLILGDRLDSIHVVTDVSQMNFTVHYKPLPFPFTIAGGRVFFDEKSITTTKLNGTLGNSSFDNLTTKINLDGKAGFEIADGQMTIAADEIYPWVTSYEKIKPVLRDLPSVKGTIIVSSINLRGALYEPEVWKFLVNGEVNKFTLDASFLPGKAEEATGRFTIAHDGLSLRDVRTRMIDSLFTFSGNFRNFPTAVSAIDLSLQGELGPKVTAWISGLIELPREMSVRAPLSLEASTLSWERDTKTKFDGRFIFGRGTKVSLRLTKTTDELSVQEISVKDRDTDVTANGMLKKEIIDVAFKGILASSSINTIFAHAMYSDSSLRGDFRAHILLKDPKQSKAEGIIDGKNLSIPLRFTIPLIVRNITLEAKDGDVIIRTAQIKTGEQELTLTGTITTSPSWFTVNMDLSSDSIDLQKIQHIVQNNEQKDAKGHSGLLGNIPVKGTLRVRSDIFQYRQFRWQPFHADISFDGEAMHIRSEKAALCGISTTGDIDITAQGAEMAVTLSAKNLELEPIILCISDKKAHVTGIFDMKADVKASGKLDTLAKSLSGSFTISAKKGKIFKSQVLDKTLDLANETENIKGKLPDLNKTIIEYRTFAANGMIKKHMVEVEQGTLDASTFGLIAQGKVDLYNQTVDLNALVAPLNFAQSFVGKIPVLGHLMGGNIVSVPVKIKGNLSDPEVTFLSPSAIGSAFLGVIERTIKLPMTIIEPVLPGKKPE